MCAKGRIVVVGPGAMGELLAARLAAAGREAWLLDKDPDRARRLEESGVVVEEKGGARSYPVRATASASAAGPAELLIFCVKAYDTLEAARMARPALVPGGAVVSLQNGAGNLEALVEVFGAERVLAGTTAQGATRLLFNRVRHAGAGETVIGQADGGTARATEVADLFNRAGLPTHVTSDLAAVIWSKLAINAAINPLTALLRVKNGRLPETRAAVELMRQTTLETKAVCDRKGIRLLYESPLDKALAVAAATAENLSSMLQDVLRKRRTEIGHINGAVVREAESLGLWAPVNASLTALVEALERNYERMETPTI